MTRLLCLDRLSFQISIFNFALNAKSPRAADISAINFFSLPGKGKHATPVPNLPGDHAVSGESTIMCSLPGSSFCFFIHAQIAWKCRFA